MTRKPYGVICPIIRACEILEPRWTIPILVGLWAGATKFNDLRREIGSISPALLSKRLKDLEAAGFVERVSDLATGSVDYLRTPAAIALEPALEALAQWAQCNVEAEAALCTATASNLMWKMRRMIDPDALPRRRVVLQFRFGDDGLACDTNWVLAQPGAPVEICTSTPGFEVDLFVETSVTSLLGVVLGRTTLAREVELGELFLSGDPVLARTMGRWLPPGDYAGFEDIAPLPRVRSRPAPARTLPPRALRAGDRRAARPA